METLINSLCSTKLYLLMRYGTGSVSSEGLPSRNTALAPKLRENNGAFKFGSKSYLLIISMFRGSGGHFGQSV